MVTASFLSPSPGATVTAGQASLVCLGVTSSGYSHWPRTAWFSVKDASGAEVWSAQADVSNGKAEAPYTWPAQAGAYQVSARVDGPVESGLATAVANFHVVAGTPSW